MTNNILRTKVREVIMQAFEMKENDALDNLDVDSVEAWDSLGHMMLMEKLELEFNLELSHSETVSMLSEDSIVEAILAKANSN